MAAFGFIANSGRWPLPAPCRTVVIRLVHLDSAQSLTSLCKVRLSNVRPHLLCSGLAKARRAGVIDKCEAGRGHVLFVLGKSILMMNQERHADGFIMEVECQHCKLARRLLQGYPQIGKSILD